MGTPCYLTGTGVSESPGAGASGEQELCADPTAHFCDLVLHENPGY